MDEKAFRKRSAAQVVGAAEYGFQIGVAENLTTDIGALVEKAVRSAVVEALEAASRVVNLGGDLEDLATWISEEEDQG